MLYSRSRFDQMSSMISTMVRAARSGGSAVMAVAFRKYSSERPVEAVEDHEVRLVGETLALARPAAEHLLEEDARPHRAQKHDELEVRDIDAGGQMSTVTTIAGCGRLRNSRMRWSGRSTRPVILATNASPMPKASRQMSTSWSAWEMCGRSFAAKMSVFGNRPVSPLVLDGVLLDLLDDPAIGVGRSDAALDIGGFEAALVFQQVELLGAGHGVNDAHLLAFVEEDAVHPHVRANGHDVVVHEETLADGPLVVVAIDDVLEVGGRVGRRCGGEADLDRVEVVESIAPDGEFLARCSRDGTRRRSPGRRRGWGCRGGRRPRRSPRRLTRRWRCGRAR